MPSPPPPMASLATSPGAASFDWENATCPSLTAEPHAVLVSSANNAAGVPVRIILALEGDERGPFEARFIDRFGASTVATGSPISTPDADTRGVEFLAETSEVIKEVRVRAGSRVVACRTASTFSNVWGGRWNGHAEALFSLWIARLFSYDEAEIHASLSEVLRRPERNLLYGHLGFGEDEPAGPLLLAPDCADFPLALRLYFAWKVGLPFGIDQRWRAKAQRPRGSSLASTGFEVLLREGRPLEVELFRRSYGHLNDLISTRRLRGEHAPDRSVLYPIALARESLRPGAVFVDAFAHVAVVAGWLDTGNGTRRLLLVDAQPSGMVALHRYFEGRLVYRRGQGSIGFQWFRPTAARTNATYDLLSSSELARRDDEHLRPAPSEALRPEAAFKETLDSLEDPRPRDPIAHYRELHVALVDALRQRGYVVAEGYARRLSLANDTPLPTTASLLFHGLGVWEADATPCRDLRLLALLRAIDAFPEGVESNPARYRIAPGDSAAAVRARLEQESSRWKTELGITYTRSDGSSFRLSLRDVFDRRAAFEMAYNPNDCPELRWGAAAGSPEAATCRGRTSERDKAQMETYRSWFQQGYGCE